ncbi:hypothetical protein JTE90_012526 [Oedothorax gibbosus]|uniref:Receptor ligand binding region domain-containing protein n=1 Tax=Oedothorax gibbosus TaxID=931172 RepID=A0AAV6UYN9_9ARAC|nr:hypothetical protein JTE90_012526 [Oedothorax gibbosus]
MTRSTRTKLLYTIAIINILLVLTNTTTTANDSSVIKLAVLAPSDENSPYALHKIVPAVLYAVRTTLRTARMDVIYRDTECSSTTGPLAAISLQTSGLADMFLGPLCPYVLAPVARYSAVWGLPILTASGQVDSFDNKDQYKTMTRMNGSYSQIGAIFLQRHRVFIHYWTSDCDIFANLRTCGHVFGAVVPLCAGTGGYRYSAVWGLPILTASGQVDSFDNKDQYKTMTRMNGSYSQIGAIFLQRHRVFIHYWTSDCDIFANLRTCGHVFGAVVPLCAGTGGYRYSAVWGLPILTASGQVDSFDNKDQYKTMTRMNGSYSQIGAIFLQVLRRFGWGVLALFFHNSDDRSVGNSDCYFTLGPVYVSLGKKSFFKEFDEANKDNNYAEMLKEISQHARGKRFF